MSHPAEKPITIELLAQCKCRQKRGRHESKEDYVARLTHIGLSKRSITEIGSMKAVSGAAAIYLYDNSISRLEGLSACRHLTALFLQRNRITKIEGLANLVKLEKLHLGRNRITVVEGIDRLTSLRELHIEDQLLPAGEKLVFDPRSVIGLAGSLRVLNVAGNRLDDLGDICHLRGLHTLNLSNNFVRSMKELERLVVANRLLKRLRVAGNPICHIGKYRETIITMCTSLIELDTKEITKIQRQFLLNWKLSKKNRATRRNQGLGRNNNAVIVRPPVSRFPSKFSSKNPHWLPPLPQKRGQRALAAPAYGKTNGGQQQPEWNSTPPDNRNLVPPSN